MKILIEIEPENIFERTNIRQRIKNFVNLGLKQGFQLKKIKLEFLE